MRATIALLMILGTCACGKADAPTAPTPPPLSPPAAPSPPEPRDAGIASFSMTGQLIQGVYHYWPDVSISAGGQAIVLKDLIFTVQGVELTRDRAGMSWTIAAGTTYKFGASNGHFEVLGTSLGADATVTALYTSADGQSHQSIATTTIPPIESAPASASLQISDFALTRWPAWNYWPRFTVTDTSGTTDVTITRVEFLLLDLGINGRVTPWFGSWKVPAGGSIRLFDEWSYGEPAFYLSTSGGMTDRVMVTLSYVDAAGRPGDVTATALVSQDGLPPAPK
jgi:hypothetical protein